MWSYNHIHSQDVEHFYHPRMNLHYSLQLIPFLEPHHQGNHRSALCRYSFAFYKININGIIQYVVSCTKNSFIQQKALKVLIIVLLVSVLLFLLPSSISYIPQFVYSLSTWWKFGWFSAFGYYEYDSYQQLCTSYCGHILSFSLGKYLGIELFSQMYV